MRKAVLHKANSFNQNCMLPTEYDTVGDCFSYSYVKPNTLVNVL